MRTMNNNYLIPAFIRTGELQMNMGKIINYLENDIKRYNNGDKEISLLEHEMNCATLKHFQNVISEKPRGG